MACIRFARVNLSTVLFIFFMVGTMLYGLAYFLPSIVNQVGFSSNKTQLLNVGPFSVGFFGAFFKKIAQPMKTYACLPLK